MVRDPDWVRPQDEATRAKSHAQDIPASPGFEGGQMPLQRRLPKRGFTNIFKTQWLEISLEKIDENFSAGDEVTPEILHERGLIKKAKHDLVILGNGDLTKALKISAHRFTKSAKEKIEKAGGSAATIEKYPTAE